MNDQDFSAVDGPSLSEVGMLEGHPTVVKHILDEILDIALRQHRRRTLKFVYPQPAADEIETAYRRIIRKKQEGTDDGSEDVHLDVDGKNVIDLYGVRLIVCDGKGFGFHDPAGKELQHHLGISRNTVYLTRHLYEKEDDSDVKTLIARLALWRKWVLTYPDPSVTFINARQTAFDLYSASNRKVNVAKDISVEAAGFINAHGSTLDTLFREIFNRGWMEDRRVSDRRKPPEPDVPTGNIDEIVRTNWERILNLDAENIRYIENTSSYTDSSGGKQFTQEEDVLYLPLGVLFDPAGRIVHLGKQHDAGKVEGLGAKPHQAGSVLARIGHDAVGGIWRLLYTETELPSEHLRQVLEKLRIMIDENHGEIPTNRFDLKQPPLVRRTRKEAMEQVMESATSLVKGSDPDAAGTVCLLFRVLVPPGQSDDLFFQGITEKIDQLFMIKGHSGQLPVGQFNVLITLAALRNEIESMINRNYPDYEAGTARLAMLSETLQTSVDHHLPPPQSISPLEIDLPAKKAKNTRNRMLSEGDLFMDVNGDLLRIDRIMVTDRSYGFVKTWTGRTTVVKGEKISIGQLSRRIFGGTLVRIDAGDLLIESNRRLWTVCSVQPDNILAVPGKSGTEDKESASFSFAHIVSYTNGAAGEIPKRFQFVPRFPMQMVTLGASPGEGMLQRQYFLPDGEEVFCNIRFKDRTGKKVEFNFSKTDSRIDVAVRLPGGGIRNITGLEASKGPIAIGRSIFNRAVFKQAQQTFKKNQILLDITEPGVVTLTVRPPQQISFLRHESGLG